MLPNQHLNFFNIESARAVKYGPSRPGTLADYSKWLHTANSTNLYISCFSEDQHPVPFAAPLQLPRASQPVMFSDIADARAAEIIAQARGRDIVVLWSGGIDSQVVLTAMLRAGARPVVACTPQSILENRHFYDQHIRNQLAVEFFHSVEFLKNTDRILVGSAVADTLVGGSLTAHYLYANYSQIKVSADLESITDYWRFAGKEVNYPYAEIFVSQVKQAAQALDADISTWWQFWNFADLVYRSSYDYWYHWPKYLTHQTPASDLQQLDQWDVHFFMTGEFYGWALHSATLEDKIGTNKLEYKRVYKDYIYSYDKNAQYHEHKIKVSSIGSGLIPTLTDGYLGRAHDFSLITAGDALVDQLEIANSTLL